MTKAYDKAWLDGILYVLHKNGVNNRLWKLIKCLNSNLKTAIQTKYGNTRQINIKDSIRQGGVLSVSLYALLMDEINKDMKLTDLGIQIPGSDTRIPCLLWMDDVLLVETSFGMPKTKYLRPGKVRTPIEMKLGDDILDETDKYTYLGEINNKAMNLKDQIKSIEGKVEAAYQTLVAVAEDQNFKTVKMECIWKLVKTCIVPIITYASETWEPTKAEMKKLNKILDRIIKRILMTPEATPREALYIETGLLDVETMIDIKRLNMMARLNDNRSELMTTVLTNPEGKWMKRTKEIMEKYNIEDEDLTSKEKANEAINLAVHMKMYRNVNAVREERSKLKFFLDGKISWIAEQPAEYMVKLTRKQASTIFKARTRMIKVKANYKNEYPDQTCRACKIEIETQQHALNECAVLNPTPPASNDSTELFCNDTEQLKILAIKIDQICETLIET